MKKKVALLSEYSKFCNIKNREKFFNFFENSVRIRPLAALIMVEGDFMADRQPCPSAGTMREEGFSWQIRH